MAFFGGSFDPPHRGHTAIARAAADHFLLDQVLFAPTARQPLKPGGATAPFADRLAMVALACHGDTRFTASTVDGPRADSGPNYTAATLQRLRLDYPDAVIFNLLGIDSFLTLASWHQPQQLLALAQCIVVSRPGISLHGALPDPVGLPLTATQRDRIHLLDTVHEEVSATDLRNRLLAGAHCDDLLPSGVPAYIRQHHLYLPRQVESMGADN